MKLGVFFESGIDIQSEYRVCYYDEERNERVVVDWHDYANEEISFLYEDDGILYIEFVKYD